MNQDELYSRIREFLEEQKKYLESTGGVSKISNLSLQEVNNLELIIFDYPELEYFLLENEETYDVFLRRKYLSSKIDIGSTINAAKNAYRNMNYKSSLSKLLLILKKAACPKSEVYVLTGLSYINLGKEEKGIDYLRLANYIEGKKDYNNVDLNEVRERVEESMKEFKKSSSYNQYNVDMDRQVHIDRLSLPNLDKIIKAIEVNFYDLATAGKKFNLTDEQIDFIKLIYAREFYKQGEIEKGDYYLKSVEESSGKTSDVTRLCLEARTNKRFFQYRDNNVPKYLSLVKTSKRKKLK